MEAYVDEVRKLEARFDGIQAEHVPRAKNDITDYLSKRAVIRLRRIYFSKHFCPCFGL